MVVGDRQQFEADRGRFLRNTFHDPTKKHQRDEIGKADPEPALRLGWIERLPRNHRKLDVQQGLANGTSKRFRSRCWDKCSAAHRKQVIAEIGAQPGDGSTHGRLTEIDSARCRGQVALGHQGIEGDEKIQVKALETHIFSPR